MSQTIPMVIDCPTGFFPAFAGHEGKVITLTDACRYLVSEGRNTMFDDGSFDLSISFDKDLNPTLIHMDFDNTLNWYELTFGALIHSGEVENGEELQEHPMMGAVIELPAQLETEAVALSQLKGLAFANKVEELVFGTTLWPEHKFKALTPDNEGGYEAAA